VSTNEKSMRLLLGKGADIHQADNNGRTALHEAADRGCKDALRLALKLKVLDDNSRDCDNRTALSLAASVHEIIDCVRILLEHDGIDLDTLDNGYGRPSLSWAVVNPYAREDSAPLLLKKGANPEINDKDGRTTLSLAVEYLESHNPLVNLLLERKEVDIESRCNHGRTPL
jgi:ankyrin repeat protein